MGLATLTPLELGVKYNRFTKVTDDDDVKFRGRHFIWPWSSFLKFPSVSRNLELSDRTKYRTASPITGRTHEGLKLELHIAFQYKLQQANLAKLYKKVGLKYESYFMKLARESIIASASRYDAPQFWLKRRELGDEMYSLVKEALDENYAECSGLQIIRIDLDRDMPGACADEPETYECAIIKTQVTRQQSLTQQNAQVATLVRANISVNNASFQRDIQIMISNATASASQLVQIAHAKANRMKLEAEKQALDTVAGNISLTSAGLVTYQRMFAYTQIPEAKFIFGIDRVVVLDPDAR